MKVGLQPYTIREIEESFADQLARVSRSGYEGIELSVDYAETEQDAIAETDLAVTSMATSPDALHNDLDSHITASEVYGTDDVVIMYIDESRFQTRDAVRELANELDSLAGELADSGLNLHYHNHDHEFVDVDGTPALSRLIEETSQLRFELDLGWAGTGGVDPAAFLESIGDRVTHVHVKDMAFDSREFVTFGEGDLDVAQAVAAAKSVDVDWVIFENDQPKDPAAEISHASLLLNQYTGHL